MPQTMTTWYQYRATGPRDNVVPGFAPPNHQHPSAHLVLPNSLKVELGVKINDIHVYQSVKRPLLIFRAGWYEALYRRAGRGTRFSCLNVLLFMKMSL